jgi:hypothetical protein
MCRPDPPKARTKAFHKSSEFLATNLKRLADLEENFTIFERLARLFSFPGSEINLGEARAEK